MSDKNSIGSFDDPHVFWDEAEALGLAVIAQLDYFAVLGVDGLPESLVPRASVKVREVAVTAKKEEIKPSSQPLASFVRHVSKEPEQAGEPSPSIWAPESLSLNDLACKAGQCRACPLALELPQGPLFGRGASEPLIVFVGPDPSIYEGGKAELLSAIIEKGLQLSPEQYYITTLTRCALKDEYAREAEQEAIDACGPILLRELALLKPKVVLALGSRAGRFLSGSSDPVGLLRARTHTIDHLEGVWLRVTIGLSHMLNSIEIKREAWKDIQKIIPGLNKLKKV